MKYNFNKIYVELGPANVKNFKKMGIYEFETEVV